MTILEFEYNGVSSDHYGIIFGSMNNQDDFPFGMEREVVKGSMNRLRSTPNHMGAQWSNVLVFTIGIVRNPCIYTEYKDMIFYEDEINEINAWLTSPDYPVLLTMTAKPEDDGSSRFCNYEYFGLFTNVTPQVAGGNVIGFDATFTCNSPFAWTPEKMITFAGSDEEEVECLIEVETAERLREVYPIIKIEPRTSASSNVMITSVTDNGRSINFTVTETTYMDCKRLMIYNESGLISFEDLNMTNLDYIYWPRLYNGTNRLQIQGDADFTFIWREPRKVGAY